ncbi:MAG: hypothetical protein ACKO0V_11740, partial [bacterium]
ASTICVCASAGSLFMDEPGGAVVWNSEAKKAESRRFRGQKSLVGAIDGFRERMERDCASIRLDHEIGSQDHGQMQHRESQKIATRRSCVGIQVVNLRERY